MSKKPSPICPHCREDLFPSRGEGRPKFYCGDVAACGKFTDPPVLWGPDWAALGELSKCPKCGSESQPDTNPLMRDSGRRRCVECTQAFYPGDQDKKLLRDMGSHPVPAATALRVAGMDDVTLVRTYLVNALPTILMGKGPFFDLQCALHQEAQRRGLKLKGKLN